MGLIDHDDTARRLIRTRFRPRPSRRLVSEFETEIRQLYVRMIDEPIPSRMIDILRAGLASPKS